MKLQRWGFEEDCTTMRAARLRVGRLQLQCMVYRHRAPNARLNGGRLGDRWVVQPSVVFDRKAVA